jgi:hypothetical protein
MNKHDSDGMGQNGPRLDMGLWTMCKYEVLLLVIAELSWVDIM